MAFHWQTFKTRALSAIAFLTLMAAGLLWNEWSFLVLFTIIHFGCWREYYKLVRKLKPVDEDAAQSLIWYFALFGWAVLFYLASAAPQSFFAAHKQTSTQILRVSGLLILFNCFYYRKKLHVPFLLSLALGLPYISLSLGLLVQLRTQNAYPDAGYALTLPLLLICTNWINDTMAYIVGSLIGKTPFSAISPKKTWEGTIGGIILAVVTISLIAFFSGLLPLHHAAALSFIGAVAGTSGDLFESKLKRMAGVKDSGTMMPGHGGFLDRFDSLLFSATAGALYIALAIK